LDVTVAVFSAVLVAVLLLVSAAVFWWIRSAEAVQEQIGALILRYASVITLGVVALFCVFGLLYLSTPPTPRGSTDLQEVLGGESTQPGAMATAAATTSANNASTLGVTGQIVSILGAIGAAAVGGIAGLLVGQQPTRQQPGPPGEQPGPPGEQPGPPGEQPGR
jgi:hypothetical protein